jgi:hypothetical protein
MNLNENGRKELFCLTKCAFRALLRPFPYTMVKQNPDSFHISKNVLKLSCCFKIFEIGWKAERSFS